MKVLNDEQLDLIMQMIPDGAYFLLVVQMQDGGAIDTNIPKEKVRSFVAEVLAQLDEVPTCSAKPR